MSLRVPNWQLSGVVTECRELKTKKDGRVWLYVLKVMALGGTFELQTQDEALYRSVGEGQTIEAAGVFDLFRGEAKFVVQDVKLAEVS